MKILVACDADPDGSLQRSLRARFGCDVLACTTASDAVALAAAERPDLIVLGEPADVGPLEGLQRLEEAGSATLWVRDKVRDAVSGGVHRGDRCDRQQLLARAAELLSVPRRGCARRSLRLRVDVYGPDGHGVAHSRDLSASGIYLKSELPLAAGDSVQLIFNLPLPDRPTVRAIGEVVRRQLYADPGRQPEGGIGIRFRKVGERNRSAIATVVGRPSRRSREATTEVARPE